MKLTNLAIPVISHDTEAKGNNNNNNSANRKFVETIIRCSMFILVMAFAFELNVVYCYCAECKIKKYTETEVLSVYLVTFNIPGLCLVYRPTSMQNI